MDVPFADTAVALRDFAGWERQRIEFMREAALRGQVQPPPDIAFAGWRERLIRIELACTLLEALAPHEPAIRAMVPELNVPVRPRPAVETRWRPPPTMWPR